MQEGGDFVPVKVDREILKSLPKTEVIIKNWGHRGGNQYYKVLLPEVPITLCKQCQQVIWLVHTVMWCTIILHYRCSTRMNMKCIL